MAVRPIDANVAMKKIREYMEGFPNANTRLATCRVILSMLGDENQIPTLTQPNEALTCKGCVYLEEIAAPCACCVRMKREVDYYLPLEKGEKDGTD